MSTPDTSELHEIRVEGHLDAWWADSLAGLTLTHESDGTTTLTGPLADQAALHGVFARLRDLALPIVSVRRMNSDAERGSPMKAIVQDTYGSAEVLQLRDIDTPVVGEDDVLVRVHAAGVHIGDWHVMTGQPYLMRIIGFGFRGPKARVRGIDVAGVVEAVGKNVTQFQAGDEVFGTSDGAFAEYALARADMLAPKPTNLTFEQAASVPTSAATALQALRNAGGIQAGQKVLIVGASGGVGMFAVQIAKSFGAEVTGVCSTAKLEMVRALGADHVIDYTQTDFTRGEQRYDLILDLGGNRALAQLRRALTPGGTLVLVGGEGGDRWLGIGRPLQALALSAFVRDTLRPLAAKSNQPDLKFLKNLIQAGHVTPVIDRTYPLGAVPEAIQYLADGRARGKLVVSVRDASTTARIDGQIASSLTTVGR